MDNIITFQEGTPPHLLAYSVGVLVGLEIDYTIPRESKLHRIVQEERRERYLKAEANGEIGDTLPDSLGYCLTIKGGNPDDIKVSLKPVWTT